VKRYLILIWTFVFIFIAGWASAVCGQQLQPSGQQQGDALIQLEDGSWQWLDDYWGRPQSLAAT
jgi:hypothetical protein